MNLALFGGAFDPFHNGHLAIIHHLQSLDQLDQIFLLPSGIPPHKSSPFFSNQCRLEMGNAIAKDHADVDVMDIEIQKQEPSYTIDTVDYIKTVYDVSKLYLVVGQDQFMAFDQWKEYKALLTQVSLLVFPRATDHNMSSKISIPQVLEPFESRISILDVIPPMVSSTDIRHAIQQGQGGQGIEQYVPEGVFECIKKHLGL